MMSMRTGIKTMLKIDRDTPQKFLVLDVIPQ